ncbi:MAG: helix-turn-helix domain-containing protein, partial [Christensenellales bacterium]
MRYLSVAQIAKKWNVSERSVRNYCAQGKIDGAFLTGKTWNIPEDAIKPDRSNKKIEEPKTLLDILRIEKNNRISGGIYHKIQIELTYNSNHIEGSKLTHEQTRYIFETNTIGIAEAVKVDDVVETANHFRCIDIVIDCAKKKL